MGEDPHRGNPPAPGGRDLTSPADRARAAALTALARSHGIQATYEDVDGRRHRASPESVLGALRALGAPVETAADAPDALRERRLDGWRRVVEPVVVAWDGRARVEARLPGAVAEGGLGVSVRLEGGDASVFVRADPPPGRAIEVDGESFLALTVRLSRLPLGYHRLRVEAGRSTGSALVISAPMRAPGDPDRRDWGVFLPLYALRTRRDWGAGDLTDLEALAAWVGRLGGQVVATLPLFASFLDEMYEPSPYAPVSRRFWNELYLDVTRLPELPRCPEARALLASPALARERAALRRQPLVDYRRAMAAKRGVLEALARCLFSEDGPRRRELEAHVRANPLLAAYARFRAACERRRTWWGDWPARMRDGRLRAGDVDREAERYHLYVQWAAHGQMESVARAARATGAGLYLDLPLAVDPAGFDVWRERDAFAPLGTRAGAPPDPLGPAGQDWGFPPLHPERIREQGYRYPIEALRHVFAHAGMVRVDHVMGLYRLFWIPEGLDAAGGVYVRYRADELFALLTLEACRHDAVVVGEDLGTVPHTVRRAMARHNVFRTYVGQFAVRADRRRAIRAPAPGTFASMNTHDMPPFARFWQGLDVADRRDRGLLDDVEARRELARRRRTLAVLAGYLRARGWVKDRPGGVDLGDERLGREVLAGCLAFLAASEARVVVANLEDLWWETHPQNVPGTSTERPNWRARARYALERFRAMPEVVDVLREVDRCRRGAR